MINEWEWTPDKSLVDHSARTYSQLKLFVCIAIQLSLERHEVLVILSRPGPSPRRCSRNERLSSWTVAAATEDVVRRGSPHLISKNDPPSQGENRHGQQRRSGMAALRKNRVIFIAFAQFGYIICQARIIITLFAQKHVSCQHQRTFSITCPTGRCFKSHKTARRSWYCISHSMIRVSVGGGR